MPRPTSNTFWTRDKAGAVDHAELGAGRIELRLTLAERSYGVVLSPAPDGPSAWKGVWMRHDRPGTGGVAARLYRTAESGFALIGDWSEDGTTYRWVAEFQVAS